MDVLQSAQILSCSHDKIWERESQVGGEVSAIVPFS